MFRRCRFVTRWRHSACEPSTCPGGCETLTRNHSRHVGHSLIRSRRLRQTGTGTANGGRHLSTGDSSTTSEADASFGMVLFDSLSSSFRRVNPAVVVSAPPSAGKSMTSHPPEEETRTSSSPKGLAWYTCGPTVYESAHLGHARTYVCVDFIHRVLLHMHEGACTVAVASSSSSLEGGERGQAPSSTSTQQLPPRPVFIMNVTDVDDKILNRAHERGEHPLALARRYEREFFEDMDALNVLRPTVVTRVSDHVERDVVPYVERIVQNGAAYVLPPEPEEQHGDEDAGIGGGAVRGESYVGEDVRHGSVYFDVAAFEEMRGGINRYGKLAPQAAATRGEDGGMFFDWQGEEDGDSANVFGRSRKRDPRDFVLWKHRKPDEELWWDSPWGQGRPGWHIECSAMIDGTMEKEWIPHWVHTGHLHIRGSKMSKSLKNFITIRQLLSSSTPSPLSSPSDDFRLWCLGLSGQYRGPATYSEERLDESKALREKLIRFLMDGEEWLRRSSKEKELPPVLWNEAGHHLFDSVGEFSRNCSIALAGGLADGGIGNNSDNPPHRGTSGFDLDGSSCVREFVKLAEAGLAYVDSAEKGNGGSHAAEPLRLALSALRGQLSLLGFSDSTVRAGLEGARATDKIESGRILGGEAALAEELVRFRSEVRRATLEDLKASRSGRDTGLDDNGLKHILQVCDDLRDTSLPAMGLKIRDTGGTSNGDVAADNDFKWRWCIPRENGPNVSGDAGSIGAKIAGGESIEGKSDKAPALLDVALEDLFRVGPYEGAFSEYDELGMPLTNADGSPVSKSLRKKLAKKRDRHRKRLEGARK